MSTGRPERDPGVDAHRFGGTTPELAQLVELRRLRSRQRCHYTDRAVQRPRRHAIRPVKISRSIVSRYRTGHSADTTRLAASSTAARRRCRRLDIRIGVVLVLFVVWRQATAAASEPGPDGTVTKGTSYTLTPWTSYGGSAARRRLCDCRGS